jgi:hypothetical protein
MRRGSGTQPRMVFVLRDLRMTELGVMDDRQLVLRRDSIRRSRLTNSIRMFPGLPIRRPLAIKFRQSFFLFAALAASVAMVACGGSGSGTTTITPPPAISVAIAGAPVSLLTNATAALTASVSNDSANAGVTWSVTCGSTVTGACGAFSNTTAASATYTAPAAIPTGGTVTVKATSVSDASKSASASITIVAISVTLSGAPASLTTNTTAALTATVNNDPANAGVTWSVTCGSAGACGTFSNPTATTATYIAPNFSPAGNTVTVTATSVSDTTKSASANITIITTVAVTLGPAPTALQLLTGAGITAFVASDSANAGVTWAVTCGSTGACGALSSPSTASGVTTDFSAPSAIPSGSFVTVTATSVTDTTKSASAKITITSANTTLADGTYIFSLTGSTGGGPYYLAGAFVVSGGAITGGEQDYVDLNTLVADAINGTGSSLATTADGNLQIVLTTCNGTDCTSTDTSVGVNGVENLDAAQFSVSRARIIEFDGDATSSGRVDQQTSAAAPAAGYAFFAAGLDASAIPLAIGGVLNVDGSGTISGSGSVFDINDSAFEGGFVLQKQSFAASTVSAPDSFGRIVFGLIPSAASAVPAISFAGYVVDSAHIRLVETLDNFVGTTGGIALSQGANTGAFSSIAGNSYVAGLAGFEGIGAFQASGIFTANSDGTVSGAVNYNDLTGTGPETPSAIVGGTYTVDATGRVTMTGVTDGTETFALQFYLTGSGQESEDAAITVDANDVLAGIGYQQTGGGSFTPPSFFGTYALDATGVDSSTANELDAVGPITADGAGTLTGSVDLNWILSVSPGPTFTDSPVSGVFTTTSAGAFTGTITGLDVTTCPLYNATGSGCTADVFTYYVIDTTKIFAIETDQKQLTLGLFTLEQ